MYYRVMYDVYFLLMFNFPLIVVVYVVDVS